MHNVTHVPQQVNAGQQPEGQYGMFHLTDDLTIDPIIFNINIEGQTIPFELDTGVVYSIIGEETFTPHLSHVTLEQVPDLSIKTYNGAELQILGQANMNIQHKNQIMNVPLLVTPDHRQSLLGRNWLFQLKLDWTEQVKDCSVNKLSDHVSPELQAVLDKHNDVFIDEIGQINGVHASILIDPQATPRFFKARPVPYELRDRIEDELTNLEKQGSICPVVFSEWASPIVPVVKTDQSIRICRDYKVTINKVSLLDPYPLPRIEDIYAQLSGGDLYSKVDLSNAYLQVPLDEKSQAYVTINTTRELYTYNRMHFGIKSSSAIFQRIMDTMCQSIKHVSVYQDDILITGSTMSEHIQNIDKVLNKLKIPGMQLKLHKCQFLKPSVTYLGHRIDHEGIHPTNDKVEAINVAPTPTTKKEMQAYLGMLNYYGRYLPNISNVLAPFHRLLCRDVAWEWNKAHKQMRSANRKNSLCLRGFLLTLILPRTLF